MRRWDNHTYWILLVVSLIVGIGIRFAFQHRLWESRSLPPEFDDAYIYLKNVTVLEAYGLRTPENIPALKSIKEQFDRLTITDIPIRDRILRDLYLKNHSLGYSAILLILKKFGLSNEGAMRMIFYIGQILLVAWGALFAIRLTNNTVAGIFAAILLTYSIGGTRGWHLMWPDNFCSLLFLFLVLFNLRSRKIFFNMLASISLIFFHWLSALFILAIILYDFLQGVAVAQERHLYLKRGCITLGLFLLLFVGFFIAQKLMHESLPFYLPTPQSSGVLTASIGFESFLQNTQGLIKLLRGSNAWRGVIYIPFAAAGMIFLRKKYHQLFWCWLSLSIVFIATLFYAVDHYGGIITNRFLTPYTTLCCVLCGIVIAHIFALSRNIKWKALRICTISMLIFSIAKPITSAHELLTNEIDKRALKRNYLFEPEDLRMWKETLTQGTRIAYENDNALSLFLSYGMLEHPAYLLNILQYAHPVFFKENKVPEYIIIVDPIKKVLHQDKKQIRKIAWKLNTLPQDTVLRLENFTLDENAYLVYRGRSQKPLAVSQDDTALAITLKEAAQPGDVLIMEGIEAKSSLWDTITCIDTNNNTITQWWQSISLYAGEEGSVSRHVFDIFKFLSWGNRKVTYRLSPESFPFFWIYKKEHAGV